MPQSLSLAQLVYERALDRRGTGVGDQHLNELLPVDAWIMRGGVGSLEGFVSTEQILCAARAFDYFGLTELAQLLRRVAPLAISSERERRLNHAYRVLAEADLVLIAAVTRKVEQTPSDFDPVSAEPDDQPDYRTHYAGVRSESGLGELPSCDQLLMIHEIGATCTGTNCISSGQYRYHDRRTVHRATGCELCPYGPDWAL